MNDNTLKPRLLWFAERVRNNVIFADIGTDHAKLPVFLVKNGKISHAIASDLGDGPIERARTYIAISGLSDRIKAYIGDGVTHLDILPPADIAICGMGGETIISIIDSAPFLKNSDIRLLLQPMTDFSLLRKYLSANGFETVDEDIVESDERMYQCMVLSYSGNAYQLGDAEAELGKICIEKRSATFLKYVQRRYDVLKKCILGKLKAGLDVSTESSLLAEYDRILKGEI